MLTAHIFTHYNTVIIINACEPNFRNIDSGLAVFRVGGCSFEAEIFLLKHLPSIKVCDCFIRVGDCSIRVGDCSIRVGDLHCFSDVSK